MVYQKQSGSSHILKNAAIVAALHFKFLGWLEMSIVMRETPFAKLYTCRNEKEEERMNKFDMVNQRYLLNEQYKDASKLNTRLHAIQRLSSNPVDWYEWIFSNIKRAPACRVLELGSGPGLLWKKNLAHIPQDWEITLSDFSPGMLREAQNNLSESQHPFTFETIDAQSIPFQPHLFDRIIANLMLYHIPDRPRAFAEIRRVLKVDGYFYAATISKTAFADLEKLMQEASMATWNESISFNLENGSAQLSDWFSEVRLHRLENTLVVTKAEPLISVIRSATPLADQDEKKFQHLHELIQQALERDGKIQMNMDIGLFEASGQR
jgi:ubiquinone/menaquinone biosynthesis C-methylase UbiE